MPFLRQSFNIFRARSMTGSDFDLILSTVGFTRDIRPDPCMLKPAVIGIVNSDSGKTSLDYVRHINHADLPVGVGGECSDKNRTGS